MSLGRCSVAGASGPVERFRCALAHGTDEAHRRAGGLPCRARRTRRSVLAVLSATVERAGDAR